MDGNQKLVGIQTCWSMESAWATVLLVFRMNFQISPFFFFFFTVENSLFLWFFFSWRGPPSVSEDAKTVSFPEYSKAVSFSLLFTSFGGWFPPQNQGKQWTFLFNTKIWTFSKQLFFLERCIPDFFFLLFLSECVGWTFFLFSILTLECNWLIMLRIFVQSSYMEPIDKQLPSSGNEKKNQ